MAATTKKQKNPASGSMDIKVYDVDGQLLRVGVEARFGRASAADDVQRHRRKSRTRRAVHGRSWRKPAASSSTCRASAARRRRLFPIVPRRWRGSPSGSPKCSAMTRIDVSGVSWGGGLAQQFAYQYPGFCRKLVLAATAPGVTMVPGSAERAGQDGEPTPLYRSRLHALDRRRDLWRRVPQRSDADQSSRRGHEGRDAVWLHAATTRHDRLDQPAVAVAAASADADHGRHRRSAGAGHQRPPAATG